MRMFGYGFAVGVAAYPVFVHLILPRLRRLLGKEAVAAGQKIEGK